MLDTKNVKINDIEHVVVTSTMLSKLFGLTTARIRQLENEGVLKKASRGKYPLQENVKKYVDYLKITSEINNGKNENEKIKIDYDEEHALLEKAKREKAELELAQMQGTMFDAADIEREMTKMLAAFRAKILAIPSKLAPQLIARSEISIIESILETEVYNALSELSEYDPELFQNDKYVGELNEEQTEET